MMTDKEFENLVLGRLAAMERSQAWLARKLGITRQALNLYFNGVSDWSNGMRERVADVLDLRVEEAA